MIIDLLNTNMSLSEALFIASDNDVIILDNKIYNEKIIIDKPNIKIIGRENSMIQYEDSHYLYKKRYNTENRVGSTTNSAVVRILDSANYVTFENLIIKNTYKRLDLPDGQAVAFKCEAHYFKAINCKFISEQDTLYMDIGTNNQIINSYIEGDVDFIFGSADCKFINCEIKAVKVNDYAYFTAPSTLIINDYGLEFENCKFYADDNLNVYLGRPWYPKGSHSPMYPKLSFNNCYFQDNINLSLVKMKSSDRDDYELRIINCLYKNEIVNGTY